MTKKLSSLVGCALADHFPHAELSTNAYRELKNKVVGLTDIGVGRSKNQDAASAYAFDQAGKPCIVLCVADGLGSFFFSERAASSAVVAIPLALSRGASLEQAFEDQHHQLLKGYPYRLREQAQGLPSTKADTLDCGSTTCVLAWISDQTLKIAHVGDSRGYWVRKGKIHYRTLDHSMAVLLGAEHTKASHFLRSALLNALGSPEPMYRFREHEKEVIRKSGLPYIANFTLTEGDMVFLASDGFYSNVAEEEWLKILSNTPWENLSDRLHQLLQKRLHPPSDKQGPSPTYDNYTFVIYRHLK